MTNKTPIEQAIEWLRGHIGRDYLNNKQRQEIERSHKELDTLEASLKSMQDVDVEGLIEDAYIRGAKHGSDLATKTLVSQGRLTCKQNAENVAKDCEKSNTSDMPKEIWGVKSVLDTIVTVNPEYAIVSPTKYTRADIAAEQSRVMKEAEALIDSVPKGHITLHRLTDGRILITKNNGEGHKAYYHGDTVLEALTKTTNTGE